MRLRYIPYLLLGLFLSGPVTADLFLVATNEGPGFSTPEEVAEVLEKGILPTFDILIELKEKKKILAGGLPTGSRTLYMIVEADSHDEIDRMLRDIPAWGVFSWEVTPLQSFEDRAEMEQHILKSLKAGN